MTDTLISALLLFLPAAVGNVTPILIKNLPIIKYWNTPLDFGRTFRGKRIFGNNKTWRGLCNGALAGGLTAVLLEQLAPTLAPFSSAEQALVAGFALGAGALLGDAIESFFKRQSSIKPGDTWFPFDQIDYIVGGLLAVSPFIALTSELIGSVFIIYFVVHLVASYLGYLLKLKEKPI